jgi:predicted nucleic acid-binding protein
VIVLDTSAAIRALLEPDPGMDVLRLIDREDEVHAPYLIDIEFLHAMRGLVLRQRVTHARALGSLADFADLPIVRYPHLPHADRIWALRDNLSAYDATFVALAEALGATLVTCDARLARTPGHRARIELFG